MSVAKEIKKNQIENLKKLISSSYSTIAWDYTGLNANDSYKIKELVSKNNGKDIVVKNRIAKIAFNEVSKNEINQNLIGKTSFLFIKNEEDSVLKEVYNFLKENYPKENRFKGGYFDGNYYDSKSVYEIASLPSKNELISMLLSVMQGSIRNLAYSLSQVSEKKEK